MKNKNKLKLSGLLLISILTITTASASVDSYDVIDGFKINDDSDDNVANQLVDFEGLTDGTATTVTYTGTNMGNLTIQDVSIVEQEKTTDIINQINVLNSNEFEIQIDSTNSFPLAGVRFIIEYDSTNTNANEGDLLAEYTLSDSSGNTATQSAAEYNILDFSTTGDGTEANPYLVSDWNDLNDVGNIDSNYLLENNLDTETTGYTEVIQNDNYVVNNLYGDFNGQNNYINGFQSGSGGLFSQIWRSNIENLGVKNPKIPSKAGILSGGISLSNMSNIYISGTLDGLGEYGIAEFVDNTSVSDTYTNILSDDVCQSTGLFRTFDNSDLTDVYTVTEFTNESKKDPIFGETCLSVVIQGSVTGSSFKDVYYDSSITNVTESLTGDIENVTGLTTSQMRGSEALNNMEFDFTNTWTTVEKEDGYNKDSYPVLRDSSIENQLDIQSVYEFTVEALSPNGDVFEYLNRNIDFDANVTVDKNTSYDVRFYVEGEEISVQSFTSSKLGEIVNTNEIIDRTGFVDWSVELENSDGDIKSDSASFEINNPDIQGNYSQNHTVTNASRLNVDAEVPDGTAIEAIVTGYNSTNEVVFTDSQQLYTGNNTIELNKSLGKYNVRFEMLQESVNKPKVNTYSFQEENRVSTDTVSTALMTVAGGILIIAVVIIIVARID